ncbi:deaminase domain-containing protein [uncultured Stenotrophomonas sp.]|uniref:deaminase domain-containing protein n=1 Tax=uncultured Stenotrophomonas sp. TaxID=165438 RepID=UPI0028E79D95|nr:deaminase domain-containing protein [uncultured Stenotrophomonas sp.]
MPNLFPCRSVSTSATAGQRTPAPAQEQTRPTATPWQVHNREATTLALLGVPAAQLDALADALAKGPIDTALLQALLDGGLPGSPLGDALSEWLAAQCVLPPCSDDEAAAWRCVLLYALRLPQSHWEVECIAERARLTAAVAGRDPLLQRLRTALYRPVDTTCAAWQEMLSSQPAPDADVDARQVALHHQRSKYKGLDTDKRHAAMATLLAELAPAASAQTLREALTRVRRHEQRDAGLLDPRAGLRTVFAHAGDAASIAAVRARLSAMQQGATSSEPDTASAAMATSGKPSSSLAAQLLAVADQASLDIPGVAQPLGRYDSAARAAVSLLSLPWQLPQLVNAGADLGFAAANSARLLGSRTVPTPEAVANAVQPYGLGSAWVQPVNIVACTPTAGEAPPTDDTSALLGRPPRGTALAPLGQCWEAPHNVPGMFREQAVGIGAFLARQPAGPTTMAARDTPRTMPTDGLCPMQRTALVAEAAAMRHDMHMPRAHAGALTDPGRPVAAAAATASPLNGAAAQDMIPIDGRLPLRVQAPLLDRLAPDDWWSPLDWQVPRTLGGLHAAITDAFAQAGFDLQHRAPSPDALAAFFLSAPALAWYDALQTLPMLPEGARRTLADGGTTACAYAFSRMLEQLTQHPHAEGERRAMHALARIGRVAVAYVQAQDANALASASAHFDALAWRTDTVAGRLETPMTDAQLQAHRARMHRAYGRPLPHGAGTEAMRSWLVQTEPALLDETTFNLLDSADTLLADLLVTLRRELDELRFGAGWNWRGKAPQPADWRDHLERKAAVAGTHWVTELGALFHQVAASLARYEDLEPPLQSVIDPRRNDLRVLTGELIAPLLQLYAGIDLPMAQADPWYRSAYPAYAGFFAWTGGARASSALADLEALDLARNPERLRPFLLPMTVTLPLPAAVLRHLLGRDRIADDPQQQGRDRLRLLRGGETRRLVAQVLEIGADDVAPELVHAFFRQLGNAPGAEAFGRWRNDVQRGSTWHLSPDEWLSLLPDSELASLWRGPGMPSNREGVLRAVQHALSSTEQARGSQDLPALWTRIMEAPQALDQWCASDDAQRVAWQHLERSVAGRSAGTRLDREATLSASTCAAMLGASAEVQLSLGDDPAGIADDPTHDAAPVLSLAIDLLGLHPALTADEALAFGAVLLPPGARAVPPARAPLSFPLLPTSHAPERGADASEDALLAALIQAEVPARADTPRADPAQLPALDDLLEGFGLSLLHPRTDVGSDVEPLTAPDAWALMSRTRQFAAFCQPLLAEAGWFDGDMASARGAQTLLARLMLERYVGRDRIDALRERFAAPEVVDVPFVQLAHELRVAVLDANGEATPAALGVLYWLLASELDQPALMVDGIPEWLTYGRSLQSIALRHGATLLDGMQPGACSGARFDDVCALPAQLSLPAQTPGAHDDLHDAWARALAPAAMAYSAAHGDGANLTRLDAATGLQMRDALALLQDDQALHALHVQQLASPPPTRVDIAAQTLKEADIDPALWSKRPVDIGQAYLARHGIVPSRLIAYEEHLYGLDQPDDIDGDPAVDPRPRAMITNDDSLQQLMVADAWVSTKGPTTASRFESAFDDWKRTVEAGLTGLIATALDGLPASDRSLVASSVCTPMRVGCGDRQADAGLLLRCEATVPGAATCYFEVIPQAGVARRVWQDAALGPLVDFEGLVNGAIQRNRDGNQLTPMSGLTLRAYGDAVTGGREHSFTALSRAATTHLWDARLAQAHTDQLARLTGLEQRFVEDRHKLNRVAEFLVPFYTCVEQMQAGDYSASAISGCVMDVASTVVPVGEFIGSTVRIARTAGEHTIQSIAAESGEALQKLGTSLVMQGGLGTVRNVAKGSLWVGSHAWESALQGADWLKRILRTSPALQESALALERAVASGRVPKAALQARRAATPTLAEAKLEDGSVVLVAARGTAWHRYDVFTGKPYGPRLDTFAFANELPATLPVRYTDEGLQVALGDTPAQFLEHGSDDWEVLIGEHSYRLNEQGTAFELITAGEQRTAAPGQWRELPTQCRPRRSLVVIPCAQQSRLRFTPDAARDLRQDQLPPGRVEGIAAATREFTLDLAHTLSDGGDPLRLMVHNGRVCAWTPSTRTAAPQLVPLPAAQLEALGLPGSVTYPDTLEGTLSNQRMFGLHAALSDAHVARLERELPVVDVGALLPGVADARRVRAIRMESPFLRALCIEPDDGVFYQAPLPAPGQTALHFTRMQPARDKAAINDYLRRSEHYRVALVRPDLTQDQDNIARLAFNYVKPTLPTDLPHHYATYDAYAAHQAEHSASNIYAQYADKVLTGQTQQRTFVGLARKHIPDWQALTTSSEEDRAAVAEILNALLPATGGKVALAPITAASLAQPDAARPILDHLNGANLAFAEVIREDGTREVYCALSDGKRTRSMNLKQGAELSDGTPVIDARNAMKGKPPLPGITSLPVLRGAHDTRTVVFDRAKDSERLIASCIADHPPVKRFRLFSLLDTCDSCGGVVVPQLRARFPDARPFSVRYLQQYGTATAHSGEPLPPAANDLDPNPNLVTFFAQWRRERGLT